MQVECPHCQTIFELTNEQLEVAGGMVRCGLCQKVFNALEDDPFYTAEEAEQAPQQEKTKASSSIDEKTEPEKSIFDFVQRDSDKETETDKNDDLFSNVQSKLIPDEYRIPELITPYSVWKDISWSLAILTLTISLFVEYAWFNRQELAAKPQLRDWVTKICNFADCEDMDLRYPKEIEMVSRNIYSHPNVKNALMISLTMANHADFAQPFPNIEIAFSDVRGNTVASRIFLPEEYLQLEKKSLRLLPREITTEVSLEIKDPGPTAMTYEFNFL